MDEVEDLYLRIVPANSQGRINSAAQIAGLNPRDLYNRMKRLGLNKEESKKKPAEQQQSRSSTDQSTAGHSNASCLPAAMRL